MTKERLNNHEYRVATKYLNEIVLRVDNPLFKSYEDITLDSLRKFLKIVLIGYQDSLLTYSDIVNISDALETYLHLMYMDDFPETLYPSLPNSDPRSLGVTVLEYMRVILEDFIMFKDDVPFFIGFLDTISGKEEEAHESLKRYISQFDFDERMERAKKEGIFG